jgi:ribosomal protein S14
MKKLLEKDKKIRKNIKILEQKKFILKTIYYNFWFINLIRLNALDGLNKLSNRSSKTFISNKCVLTRNKKRFNKLTSFSRIIFRQLAKKEKISGIYKSSR